jgi:DMSO/TMAO reductase YedYZ heme-binding membrane subunit
MTPSATLILILALTLCYSILRYHLFGDVPWAQLPLYVLNKAISWSAVTLLALAYLRRNKPAARDLGVLGLFLAFAHILMSFSLLSPAYYAKFYSGPQLTAYAGAALLAGVAASVVLALPGIATLPGMGAALGDARWIRWQRAGYWALALTAAHCAFMGWQGWLTPAKWHGGLPPITLLGTLTALLPLVLKFRARPERLEPAIAATPGRSSSRSTGR